MGAGDTGARSCPPWKKVNGGFLQRDSAGGLEEGRHEEQVALPVSVEVPPRVPALRELVERFGFQEHEAGELWSPHLHVARKRRQRGSPEDNVGAAGVAVNSFPRRDTGTTQPLRLPCMRLPGAAGDPCGLALILKMRWRTAG
jgi:hypothetical protein